jgi:hypothetical protein
VGQVRSTTATGTKTRSQLSEGFSDDFMLVIHQVTGTHYNAEHKESFNWSLGTIVVTGPKAWAFYALLERPPRMIDGGYDLFFSNR